MACGRTVIWTDGENGHVFTGVGPFGWKRHFDWSEVTGIEEEDLPSGQSQNNGKKISLMGERKVSFGSFLNSERRYFIVLGLRYELARRAIR